MLRADLPPSGVTLVARILLVALLGLLAACPRERSREHRYPASTVEAFLRSCEATSRGRIDFCHCVLAKIEGGYSFEEFAEAERQMKAGRPDREFVDFTRTASEDCLQR